MTDEHQRILKAYRLREKRPLRAFFGYEGLAHLIRVQERHRETLRLLRRAEITPISGLRILDVGCGDGNMLGQFVHWGASPANLAGIDLRADAIEAARQAGSDFDLRVGSAERLPWADGTFDLVCLQTVMTSILDPEMRLNVATEVTRAVRPGGAVLWYDFMYDNPRNPDVRGIRPKEIRRLFPGFRNRLRRITLAPFTARRLPESMLPILYPVLSAVPILRTHYLGLLTKPPADHTS